MQKEDVRSARNIIDEAADITPNDPEVNLVKAKIALYNKNFEKAIISLRTVVMNNPEKLEAYILLSESHKANKEDNLAKLVINQAYANNRSNLKVLLPLAKYHLPRQTGRLTNPRQGGGEGGNSKKHLQDSHLEMSHVRKSMSAQGFSSD